MKKTLVDSVETVQDDLEATELVIDPSADVLLAGSRVGPWRIEHLLGSGGMGDVYAVIHEEIGKRAAMKVMHRTLSDGLDAERMLLEGQVVNQFDHPGIVDIFDVGELDERPYLVMERLHGTTLAAVKTELAFAHSIEVLVQLCNVLGAAHAAGIIHRDLKPENVFLLPQDGDAPPRVKLLDWGIAKVVGDPTRRTMEGQLVGTPDYVAPEQAAGKPVSPATDIYALGVIAYELFLGQLPFQVRTVTEMLMMHLHEPPELPSRLWPTIPARLECLLLAMLTKDPQQRPSLRVVRRELRQLAHEFLDRTTVLVALASDRSSYSSFNGFMPTMPAPVVAAAPSVERRRRVRRITLGTAVFAAGAALSVALVHCDPTSPPSVSAAAASLPVIAPLPLPPPALPPAATAPVVESPRPVAAAAPRPVPLPRRTTVGTAPVASAVQPAVETTSPVVETTMLTSDAVVELYVRVGRELQARRSTIDVSDLWTSYRIIRIYQSLATADARTAAAATLHGILREIHQRSATEQN